MGSFDETTTFNDYENDNQSDSAEDEGDVTMSTLMRDPPKQSQMSTLMTNLHTIIWFTP